MNVALQGPLPHMPPAVAGRHDQRSPSDTSPTLLSLPHTLTPTHDHPCSAGYGDGALASFPWPPTPSTHLAPSLLCLQVWDDGTVAAPVAALKEEPAEMAEREGDPDYSDDPVEEHLSDEVGGDAYELESDEDAAYSDGPMGS